LTQLINLYPKNWEVFIANSSVVTVSNVNDVTTTEYFSSRAGRHEVDKSPTSNNLPVSKIYDANPDTQFLFFEGQAMPTICEKLRYDEDDPFLSRADENPMQKGKLKRLMIDLRSNQMRGDKDK